MLDDFSKISSPRRSSFLSSPVWDPTIHSPHLSPIDRHLSFSQFFSTVYSTVNVFLCTRGFFWGRYCEVECLFKFKDCQIAHHSSCSKLHLHALSLLVTKSDQRTVTPSSAH